MKFSLSEKKNMYDTYIRANRNSRVSSENYLQQYPERMQPNRTFFQKLERCMSENGTLERKRGKYHINPTPSEINVLAQVYMNPETSTTAIAMECGLSQRGASKILRKYKFHDYKFTIVQGLRPNDHQNRLHFCRWFSEKLMEDPQFPKKMLWSDESTFTNNGLFNRKNHHHWANTNPHLKRESRHQIRFSVNVWCGLMNDRIIGPYFIDGTLNGAMYLDIVENYVEEFLQTLPVMQYMQCWYQHDGAPAHNNLQVREFLNNRFGEQWIGRNGPINWPARSPDMNPMDYFFWGVLKDYVYRTPINNANELRNRITEGIMSITPQQLQAATQCITERVRLCTINQGNHFEHI